MNRRKRCKTMRGCHARRPANQSINQSQCHKSSQALVELGEEYRRTDSNHSYHAGCIRLNHDKKIKTNKEEKCTLCVVV